MIRKSFQTVRMVRISCPLRMLRLVNGAARRGEPFMRLERASWRLSGELADWLGIEAGHLAVVSRADVVVDPAGLTAQLDAAAEAVMPELDGFVRIVRRKDSAIQPHAGDLNRRTALFSGGSSRSPRPPPRGSCRAEPRSLRARAPRSPWARAQAQA